MNIAFPHPPGSGGPGSFQIRFEKELKKRGYQISYAGESKKPDIVFVVGGTKRLFWLWIMKRKGVPIIYRLDGISWLHKKKKVGVKNFLLAEFRNWSSKIIHAILADRIIYQSNFVKNWWDNSGWKKRKKISVIHNGVEISDKEVVTEKPKSKRLVILEGTIDYTPYAVQLINDLAEQLPEDISIELYGKFENPDNESKISNRVKYGGFLDRKEVKNVMKGSVYLSLDINPACPNTVIEAMSCGAPVVAFDTGALPELVKNGSGEIVPYGSDPWKLGYPDSSELSKIIKLVFHQYPRYSKKAFQWAKEHLRLEMMVESYINKIQTLIK